MEQQAAEKEKDQPGKDFLPHKFEQLTRHYIDPRPRERIFSALS